MAVKINIPQHALQLVEILVKNGYKAYVVGGCVRDSILNKNPDDWDICTSATPSEMQQVFSLRRD